MFWSVVLYKSAWLMYVDKAPPHSKFAMAKGKKAPSSCVASLVLPGGFTCNNVVSIVCLVPVVWRNLRVAVTGLHLCEFLLYNVNVVILTICISIDLSSETEDKGVEKTECVFYDISHCFVMFTLHSNSDENDNNNASLPSTPLLNRYVVIKRLLIFPV